MSLGRAHICCLVLTNLASLTGLPDCECVVHQSIHPASQPTNQPTHQATNQPPISQSINQID